MKQVTSEFLSGIAFLPYPVPGKVVYTKSYSGKSYKRIYSYQTVNMVSDLKMVIWKYR